MNGSKDRIVIWLSKDKLALITVGSLAFVAVSFWLFISSNTQSSSRPMDLSPTHLRFVPMMGMVFFSLCAAYGSFKFFDKSPGLILDREGLIDNSSGIAVGRVPWKEIRDVRVMTVWGQRFLALIVRNPKKFLKKGNILQRLLLKINYNMIGTPVSISANSLEMKLEDLAKQVHDFRKRHGRAR